MFTVSIFLKRAILPITYTLALLLSTTSQADTFTVEQLMQTLAQTKPSRATFIEKKQIALLDQPVESSGELFFTAPDYLEKRTLLPKPESLIVNGQKILIERGSKTYYFTLQNLPELAAFINSIRGTLAGDLKSLKRDFQLHLAGSTDKWSLQLIPTNEKMKTLLQHIRIAGFNNQIQNIEILQTDGDSAVMTINSVGKTPR